MEEERDTWQQHMDRAQASELLDVYRGVPGVPYEASLRELASGPLLALEVRGEDVVNAFREFTGPYCVEVARQLAPDSLRARFGSRARAETTARRS